MNLKIGENVTFICFTRSIRYNSTEFGKNYFSECNSKISDLRFTNDRCVITAIIVNSEMTDVGYDIGTEVKYYFDSTDLKNNYHLGSDFAIIVGASEKQKNDIKNKLIAKTYMMFNNWLRSRLRYRRKSTEVV